MGDERVGLGSRKRFGWGKQRRASVDQQRAVRGCEQHRKVIRRS